jgi:hypothetical protein
MNHSFFLFDEFAFWGPGHIRVEDQSHKKA